MDDLIKQASLYLKEKLQITVFTGAGISAESGISTYRDKQTGLWENFNPMTFGTSIGFLSDPETAWNWYQHRRENMQHAQPNPAHIGVAKLQTLKPTTEIITQNIDDLHERAGSVSINHLHGDMFVTQCFANCQGTPTYIEVFDDSEIPPKCPHCDHYLRPSVVWFGEALPVQAVRSMRERIKATDLLLVIGLSGAITYGIPQFVKEENQGIIIEINPNVTTITPHADIFLQAPAGDAMPQLMKSLEAIL